MSTETSTEVTTDDSVQQEQSVVSAVLRSIIDSSWLVVLIAIVASLLLGGVLVVLANDSVAEAFGYFFSRPSDTFHAIGQVLGDTYAAMFKGAIYNTDAHTFGDAIKPITQSATMATPLIFAGLGLGVGFRAGLFNIGAQGQIIIGATVGAFVGFTWDLPVGLHLVLAVLGTVLGGALWGFIPGVLKAATGAHEVIVTIMLNYVALNLVSFLLSKDAFQVEGSDNPLAPAVGANAMYPKLLGNGYALHWGFVVALLAAVAVWWLMERSTWGLQFRAVGANARAARTAGMSVGMSYVLVLVIAGALAGLAASAQVLGTQPALSSNVAASFGFDAITVALLGRSRPLGIVLAALLFGALKASGPALQVQAHLPIDVVLVVQSLIVLFIAAPPLVRALVRLPKPRQVKEVTA